VISFFTREPAQSVGGGVDFFLRTRSAIISPLREYIALEIGQGKSDLSQQKTIRTKKTLDTIN
ncbi:MAG: hypothetical protein PHT43_04770, partial [Anaerolineaceae bacterium]|nr:hypothetical protein [Anaerolineaceae bacterium]